MSLLIKRKSQIYQIQIKVNIIMTYLQTLHDYFDISRQNKKGVHEHVHVMSSV